MTEGTSRYFLESKLIKNYIELTFFEFKRSFDLLSVPVYHENGTLISRHLCRTLLNMQLVQINREYLKEEKMNKKFKGITEGNSSVFDCFFDEGYIKDIIRDIRDYGDEALGEFPEFWGKNYRFNNYPS